MNDIVERLRDKVPMIWGDEGFMITDDDTVLATFKEAADEIERLREALRYMVENPEDLESFWQIARAALGEGKE